MPQVFHDALLARPKHAAQAANGSGSRDQSTLRALRPQKICDGFWIPAAAKSPFWRRVPREARVARRRRGGVHPPFASRITPRFRSSRLRSRLHGQPQTGSIGGGNRLGLVVNAGGDLRPSVIDNVISDARTYRDRHGNVSTMNTSSDCKAWSMEGQLNAEFVPNLPRQGAVDVAVAGRRGG